MALICLLTACKPSQVPLTTPETPSVSQAGVGGDSHLVTLRFTGDCAQLEDAFGKDEKVETLPCVFDDNGQWKLVTDWDRQDHIKLYRCSAEDGGKQLPCIFVSKHPENAQWHYIVYIDEAE